MLYELDELSDIQITDIITDKLSETEAGVLLPIAKYLLKNDFIDNNRAQSITGKGPESIKKYLSTFVKKSILISTGEYKGRKYKLNDEVLKKYSHLN